MSALQLGRAEARRIAIRAQRLDADRPTDFLELVRHLTFLQLDPTAAIAPSADLIAWSRLGSSYQPEHLKQGIERDRTLFEHNSQDSPINPAVAMVRPTSDLDLHLAEMSTRPPGASAASAPGISRSGSILPASKSCRRRRRSASATSAGCDHSALLGR